MATCRFRRRALSLGLRGGSNMLLQRCALLQAWNSTQQHCMAGHHPADFCIHFCIHSPFRWPGRSSQPPMLSFHRNALRSQSPSM